MITYLVKGLALKVIVQSHVLCKFVDCFIVEHLEKLDTVKELIKFGSFDGNK